MKQKAKKLLSGLLALALVLGLAPAMSLTAQAADQIKYLDENGAEQICTNYTEINGGSTQWMDTVTNGWYVLNHTGALEITGRITVTGNVHLILVDDCTLTASNGIQVAEGNSLTIYGQSEGDDVGKLNATTDNGDAAIGGNGGGYGEGNGGSITINGGTVTATNTYGGAAIGGGLRSTDHGSLTLCARAKVEAGDDAAGARPVAATDRVAACRDNAYAKIAPCDRHTDGDEDGVCDHCGVLCEPVPYIDPTDAENPDKSRAGCVPYTGQTVLTSGWYVVTGTVTNNSRFFAVSGDVHLILCDGALLMAPYGIMVEDEDSLTVWAQSTGDAAGKLKTDNSSAADATIGCHGGWSCGTVTINGGMVEVISKSYGAGIGGIRNGAGGTVTVNGGTVEVAAGSARAIGGGAGSTDHGSLALYPGLKVIAGNDKSDAQPVAAADRVAACHDNRYAKIAPCGPHAYENGVCRWCANAVPAVRDVTAAQVSSESGTVEIAFTLSGDAGETRAEGEAAPYLVLTATDSDTGQSWTVEAGDAALSVDDEGCVGHQGSHTAVWDMSGALGMGFSSKGLVFTVEYRTRPAEYCVVDLSAGPTAAARSYAVSYLDAEPPGGFNTDVYKTTKLVLRLIRTGGFEMGETSTMGVILTNAYYMGLFETTQKQWEQVMGDRPSFFKNDTYYATRPVEQVSYDMIRGVSAGTNWPSSAWVDNDSFLGKLRPRSMLTFDLPTEAQWEYACRAGTTSPFNNGGKKQDDMEQLGRCLRNCGNDAFHENDAADVGTATVGSYKPNSWGLYDMHGNVLEWCLDWYADRLSGGAEPVGPATGEARVYRGGNIQYDWDYCASGVRYCNIPKSSRGFYGFRLCLPLKGDGVRALCSGASAPVTISIPIPPVPYLDPTAEDPNRYCDDCVPYTGQTVLTSGWYVLNSTGTMEIADRITVNGDVYLILCDGCTLDAQDGIQVAEGNSLTIYGQSQGTGTLNAAGTGGDAAIGGGSGGTGWDGDGGNGGDGGTVTVNGGTVTATTNSKSPAIGGGSGGNGFKGSAGGTGGSGGTVTVNGGTVTATANGDGTAIGGGAGGNGWDGDGGNGGDGGSITVNGGTVEATAKNDGAAIGGGMGGTGSNNGAPGAGGAGGTLSLYADAKVTAGDNAETAKPVPAAERADSCTSRYVCIEPCDHSEYTESACKWCGTPRKYSVTFVDEDGTVLKAATEYDYGTPAGSIEKPDDPTKQPDAQYTYAFDKWSPDIAEVTGDATYTATYKRTAIRQNTGGYVPAPTYAVNVAETEHGTLAVSTANARPGTKVTVTPQPEEGYETDTVKVTDWSGKEIPVTKNDDGTYSFTMPKGAVNVTATFKEKAHDCPSKHLKDVDENAWYHEYVDYVIENGLMYGIADDRFGPDVTTSRAMIVTILYRLEGSPAVSGANPFDDVEEGSWYADAVAWAEANEIVEGYGNRQFGPTDPITREQMAAIMFRYSKFKGYDTSKTADLSVFTDNTTVSDWAVPAMKWAVAEGLIAGRTTTTLVPRGNATRAEAAAILMRYIEKTK